MKTLYESLLDDFEDLSDALSPKTIKEEIKQFLKANYKNYSKFKISRIPNDDGLYEVTYTGKQIRINYPATTLTNGLFKFTDFDGSFHCNRCPNLTSLEGAPEKVGGIFCCDNCASLTSLEGAPKEVGLYFCCDSCASLTSLEGAPNKCLVFNCSNCPNLKSLKGAPRICARFDCSYCENLKSLEGAPREIVYAKELHMHLYEKDGEFACEGCGFTKDDVKRVCNVAGEIVC